MRLSLVDQQSLKELVVHRLSEAELEAPLRDEKEPKFTGRVVVPWLKRLVGELNIKGITIAGDGAAPLAPTAFGDLTLKPDAELRYHGECLIAIEVKFLRQIGRQQALCTAIGQAVLYQRLKYPHSAIFLVDTSRGISAPVFDYRRLSEWLAVMGIDLVYRQQSREKLRRSGEK